MKILIKDIHLLDPYNKVDEIGDIYIEDGKVKKEIGIPEITILGKSLYFVPGFVDIHTHIREPGGEDVENFESGSKAAVSGGYTSIFVFPNTNPPIDNKGMVSFVLKKADEIGLLKIYPVGAATVGRNGEKLTEMKEMSEMGCIAFTDDGEAVKNTKIVRRILEYLKNTKARFIEHPEDKDLSDGGIINEGFISISCGIKGIPDISESIVVSRDIQIAKYINSPIHFAHISSEVSLDIIKFGRNSGASITFDVTPHHLILSENDIRLTDSNFKMNPPLRKKSDCDALLKALKEEYVDAIATDHAPHPLYTKELEFPIAPFGVIGLETSFSSLYTKFVNEGSLSLNVLLSHLSFKPAKIFNVPFGEIRDGGIANFTVLDLKKEWIVKEENFYSLSKNSPFIGWKMKGKVLMTLVEGNVVYNEGEFIRRKM